MELSSPYWDEIDGVCTKHWLPSVPCPQCLATRDVDIEVRFSDEDVDVVAADPNLCLADLLPTGFEYLLGEKP